MAKGDLLGHINCPTCGFVDMEVKEDKSGNPYGYCMDCTQQIFTHGGDRGQKLMAQLRPVEKDDVAVPAVPSASVIVDKLAPLPKREDEPEPQKKSGSSWEW